jgi:hypothetical protein
VNERQLRQALWQASFKLANGTKAERAEAFETIKHLIFVLDNININEPKKEGK